MFGDSSNWLGRIVTILFVPAAEEGGINVTPILCKPWLEANAPFSLLHSAIMGGDLVEFYWAAFYGGHSGWQMIAQQATVALPTSQLYAFPNAPS